MVKHRALSRGIALVLPLALPAILAAQPATPSITNIQSGFGSPSNGAAITAGTTNNTGNGSDLLLYINGAFNTSEFFEAVTWTENGTATPLLITGFGNTQLVANVPANLYAAPGSASIVVTETVPSDFAAAAGGNPSNAVTYTVNPVLAGVGALPNGIVAAPYSAPFFSGGTPPYTFQFKSSPSPPGLSPGANTTNLAGTPTAVGTFAVNPLITDSWGNQFTPNESVTIVNPPPPPLQMSTTSLPNGMVGQTYVALIVASGGTGNYTFTVVSGSLPSGVTLALQGQLFGTPTAPGTFTFTAQVNDTVNTVARAFSIQIAPAALNLTGTPPSSVQLNSSISVQFGATGGVPPYKFALTGTPPAGTSFSGGLLNGTATAPGTFSFTVTVSDSESPAATISRTFTITVTPAPLTISASLPSGQVGQAYSGQFSASGGTGGYTWTGSAGDGLSVSPSGAVAGTPTAAGTVSISVTVTDSSGSKANGTFSVTIAPPSLTITTTTLPNGALTAGYSTSLGATGGAQPYTWAATGLPNGLSISSSGAITGTPAALGTFTVSVTVTDANGVMAKANLSLTINPAPLKITTTGITPPALDQSFSLGFGATGGTPPYTWTAAGLPSGVTMASNGTLSGTPTGLGSFSITVTVTDSNGQTASEPLSLVVTLPAAPGVNFNGLPANGTAGSQASSAITFNGTYPVDVTVNLTLTFAPASGPDDPNIQFSTGGRTATVTVKAGSTTSATNIGVQTGTVAGVITITAQLIANGTDITPSPPPTRTIVIGAAAPTISSVSVSTSSAGFTVTIIGFDPTKAITQATFTFTPAVGSSLQTATVTVPVQSLFSGWYQSSTSAQYGSQFSFSLPFTVSGNVSGIASVSVTLTNGTGTSPAMSAPI